MGAAITFPAALFIYAWCTFPNVHWISLCIAITVSLSLWTLLYPKWMLSYGASLNLDHRVLKLPDLPCCVHIPRRLVSNSVFRCTAYVYQIVNTDIVFRTIVSVFRAATARSHPPRLQAKVFRETSSEWRSLSSHIKCTTR